MVAEKLEQYRTGRNYVRLGDTVRVSPAGKRSYLARVTGITASGDNYEVEVYGPYGFRTFKSERVARTQKKIRGDD